MSQYIPNARVSVFRDKPATQTTDGWGQQVDDPAPTSVTADATGLPVYISQKTQNVSDPGSGTITVVTTYTVRARPAAFAFERTDRLQDAKTGAVYQVNAVSANTGTVQATDIVLTCKRVT